MIFAKLYDIHVSDEQSEYQVLVEKADLEEEDAQYAIVLTTHLDSVVCEMKARFNTESARDEAFSTYDENKAELFFLSVRQTGL